MKRKRGLMALLATMVMLVGAAPAFAGGEEPPPVSDGCNSGRGNLSESNPGQLNNPHTGAAGGGTVGTLADECDPGASGGVNRGGD